MILVVVVVVGLAISWTTRNYTSSWSTSRGGSSSATCALVSGKEGTLN